MKLINELKNHYPHPGRIEWIGLRINRSREMLKVDSAELILDHGIAGDKAAQKPGGKRQITLVQAEYFSVMESLLNKNKILPNTLRRNIVVSGLNLSTLLKHILKINGAVIEITGNCAPCAKMEKSLGFGAYNAMHNHGGINAIVRKGGVIRVGDSVEVCLQDVADDLQQTKLL